MKLKSLLLGSAAALVAVTGARAADAVIIPEPEMVEYVRVCDAAGTGYFYIPGTEVCLKISGYVQFDMEFAENQGGWDNDYEARLQFDAWTDTEYGPLATTIRTTAANAAHEVFGFTSPVFGTPAFTLGSPSAALNVDRAYFDLAGLRIGLDASAFDFGISGETDAFGNGRATGVVRYTATVGATSITLSLEEDDQVAGGPGHDWMPNIVVAASGSMGDVSYTAAFAYDEASWDSGIGGVESQWTAKAVVSFMNFNLGVQYSQDDDPGFFGVDTNAFAGPGEWYVAGSYDFEASDKLTLTPAVAYASNTDFAAPGSPNMWRAGVTALYDVTDTLSVRGVINYSKSTATPGTWAGQVRFKSTF